MTDPHFEQRWQAVLDFIKTNFGKTPDLNGILFIIGVQELGKGFQFFTKEQKQDLMHIGICRILSKSGFYQYNGTDTDGWPHYKLLKDLPSFNLLEQENLLKIHVIEYFEEIF